MPRQPKKGARVACIITGKEKYIAECFLTKKIAKFGTLDKYREFYVSNQAKRCLKKGMTIAETREHLSAGKDLPEPDFEILAKLKLLKKKRKAKDKEFTEEDREKSRQVALDNQKSRDGEIKEYGSFGAWVRENTRIGIGGTCQRPDFYLSVNDESCDGCPLYEFCLCDNRHLAHESRRKK